MAQCNASSNTIVAAAVCCCRETYPNRNRGDIKVDMTGKTAIITGAARGIGKACAEKLARCGAQVVLADIDEAEANRAASAFQKEGLKAAAYRVDMSSVTQIRRMMDEVIAKFGGVDILVNNAGILHSTQIEDVTEQEWDKICDINLKAVFFAVQACTAHFKEKRYGKVVNMSSLAGRSGGIANGIAYSATKAGVIGLTKGMATRLAPWSINVNCVCPGTTRTDILKTFTDEKIKELETKIPLGRLGSAEDIANVVCFLCSDEAGFMTGATVDVNGGMYIG